MRACPACKASVADEHKFCGYCGAHAPVQGSPSLPKAGSERSAADASPSNAPRPAIESSLGKTRPEAPLSPLATSAVMDSPVAPRIRTAPTPVATPSGMSLPQVKQEAADAGSARRGLAVFVRWSDGRKYAGTLARIEGGQCLVLFQDGQQRWIDRALVEFVRGA